MLLALTAMTVRARVVSVGSAAAIQGTTWHAGDTLLMTGGSWLNQQIRFSGTGTASAPIVLRTASPGSTTLTGSSSLSISGSHLVVEGLLFAGNYTGTTAIVTFEKGSSHCRLTKTEIRSYNPNLNPNPNENENKWVSLNGQDHRVDHCAFSNKTNIGTLLVVWLQSGQQARHRIDHNYFGPRTPLLDDKGAELNGQEIIRIGDSSTSMTDALCVVDTNYFEHCNGEIEIISNKSCGNIYRANTFYECKGTLTLRHGNACTVEYNYFLGNKVDKTGGVRIIGEDHIVRYNTMYQLTGTNYRAAICVVRGKQNSALNEYFPVVNAQIYGNTFIECKQGLKMNYNSSSDCTVDAVGTQAYDNTTLTLTLTLTEPLTPIATPDNTGPLAEDTPTGLSPGNSGNPGNPGNSGYPGNPGKPDYWTIIRLTL